MTEASLQSCVPVSAARSLCTPCLLTVLWLSFLQMDVVYTFQSGQAPVPGALRRQPSVVSQHNDATAAKTLSSPTHVGLSPSSSLTNSSGAPPPPAAASSSTAGSELVMKGQQRACIVELEWFSVFDVHERLHAACVATSARVSSRCLHILNSL